MLIVIDVSHWQPPENLNWKVAEDAGAVGVIVKATQGAKYEDPEFFEHSLHAYKEKVPLLGAYHFGDGTDAKAQAKHFLDRLRRAYGEDLTGLMLMLDAERNNPQMNLNGAEEFVSEVYRSENRWPWIYMGKFGPSGQGMERSEILLNCPLLLPKYGPEPKKTDLPPGFRFPENKVETAGVFRGWQFTDGTIHGGPFPGLGKVDQSRLIGVDTVEEARGIWAK